MIIRCFWLQINIRLEEILIINRGIFTMNTQEKLKNHHKKTITLEELKKLYKIIETSEIYPIIQNLVECGNLKPVKNSGMNGNRKYPLYIKYRIVTDNQEVMQKIHLLHPKLQENRYLEKHPDKYIKYQTAFQLIHQYLSQNPDLSIAISKKERSFEIFHEEKMLEDSEFLNILSKINLNHETLAFYETPEYCFHDYIPHKKDAMTILILENKDIWFNLRRIMFEHNASTLFQTKIDGVLYGEGKRIASINALSQYSMFLHCEDIHYLYWGDIDREGLNIYCSLVKNSEACDITLFIPAYEKMLELSTKQSIPNSNDQRNIMSDYSDIFLLFSLESRRILKQSLENNKRIPQEIINYKWLKKNME